MSLAELLAPNSPVMELARAFEGHGSRLYLVGGFVRDTLMGRAKTAPDHDFATDAPPEKTLEIVKPLAEHVWLQGIEFGTVGAKVGPLNCEITTFRTERYQPSSRHPEVSFAADIETDLSRRDFTVNAIAVQLPEQTAIDPYDGVADIKAQILRTPIDPRDSFTDDPLRMLRAFRFVSQLGFSVAPEVLEAITELRDELKNISAERVRDELSRLLVGDHPRRALELADETGLTDLFLPELSALKLEQDPVHQHKDVFKHTLVVLEGTEPKLELRLSALLHDIGKPRTREIGSNGVTFHNHQIVGAKMARKRLTELRFPNDIIETVRSIIYLHHRFHGYDDDLWTDSAVRRYVRDAGENLEYLNKLVRADCTTRNKAKSRMLAERMDELERRIEELEAEEQIKKLRPELDGREVMELLGLQPGPSVGKAMNYLMDLRLDEGILGEDEVKRRLQAWASENLPTET